MLTRNTSVDVSRRVKNQDNPETSIYDDYSIHQNICRIIGVFLHKYLWLALLVMFGYCYKSPERKFFRAREFLLALLRVGGLGGSEQFSSQQQGDRDKAVPTLN